MCMWCYMLPKELALANCSGFVHLDLLIMLRNFVFNTLHMKESVKGCICIVCERPYCLLTWKFDCFSAIDLLLAHSADAVSRTMPAIVLACSQSSGFNRFTFMSFDSAGYKTWA